jgi:putative spermidine/putrescine transport system ATP-binding protein
VVEITDQLTKPTTTKGETMSGTRPNASQAGFETLQMRDVSRVYGKTAALTNLSLELKRGEFVALLGPSGCGKSTALACMAGLQPLTTGSIWRDEKRIDTLPAEKRGFGMVFQNYALFPHLSVQKNVEFGLAMRQVGRAERRQRAAAALELVQLQAHASKIPAQLSGGQQQRVAIARALAIDPEIILMDEPLSNLDAALRIEMRTEIKRLYQERDLSVLYVTHDQEEALSLATRLVVLRLGELEQTGTPEEVYTNPVSAYVAGFMGYRNLFPARIEREEANGRVRIAADGLELTGRVVVRQDSAKIVAAAGNSATIAIRPEDIEVASAGSVGENSIQALIEVVEYHGRELAVRARTAEGTVIHFKTTEPLVPGNPAVLTVAPDRVLVFPGEGSPDDGNS